MSVKKVHWSLGLIIFLIAFIQFGNTLGHDFAWDDKIVIQENDRVQKGFSGIPELFKKYNSGLRKDQYGYRPITLTTFAVDYAFSNGQPGWFHFMNIVYFGLLCIVLFHVMKRIFYRHSLLLPFLITVLFSVHPIHTEVVANIKSRDEILALLFCLLSLLQLLKFIETKGWKHIALTIVFFVLGFLSKENAVVFLPIYLLSLFHVSPSNWKRILKIGGILIPIGLVVVYLISSYSLNSQLGKGETEGLSLYQENFILGNAFFYVDQFINKIGNAAYLILLYLKDFLAPFNLAYYHGYGDLQPVGIASWQAALGMIVSASALGFALLRFKKKPILSYGILFFFFSLSIYLHVLRTLSDTRADRFLFFASIGLIIILVGIVSKLLKVDFTSLQEEKVTVSGLLKKLNTPQKAVFAGILLFFSVITFSRNSVWENDFTLIENDMERLESSARPHYFYATNLLQQIQQNGGDREKETLMIHHYERSIELSDSIYYARIELGTYLLNQGNLGKGIDVLEETVKLFPNVSDPRHHLGQAYIQAGQYEKAIPQLKKSIEYAPKSPDSYYLLAIAYGKTKQYKKGIDLAEKGLRIFPESKRSMYEALGHVYFDKGDMKRSTENTLKMIEFGGDPYTAYATVIGRYQEKGDNENAARYYNAAVQQGIMTPQ